MAIGVIGGVKSLIDRVFLKDLQSLKNVAIWGMDRVIRLWMPAIGKTGDTVLAKVESKASKLVSGAIIRRLRFIHSLLKIIIYDNEEGLPSMRVSIEL
jgi:hypothetical protein